MKLEQQVVSLELAKDVEGKKFMLRPRWNGKRKLNSEAITNEKLNGINIGDITFNEFSFCMGNRKP